MCKYSTQNISLTSQSKLILLNTLDLQLEKKSIEIFYPYCENRKLFRPTSRSLYRRNCSIPFERYKKKNTKSYKNKGWNSSWFTLQ